MKTIIIHRPSAAAISILQRKVCDRICRETLVEGGVESVGVCQGNVLEIITASDIAEKTSDVMASEINGSCPQHMTCLAIIGKTSAVVAAIEAINKAL